MKRFLTIFISILVVGTILGQQGKGERNRREQIESAKIALFTSTIDLTPDEAKLFWPLYNKYEHECREAHKATRESLFDLKNIDKNVNATQIQSLIDKMHKNRINEIEVEQSYLNEFYKILPPEKVAKIYVAEEEFRMKMIHFWRNKERGEEKE